MVHAVTIYNSYHSGTCKFIKCDVNAVQLPLTLVTTQLHIHLLSISPDVLKVNAAQELKACPRWFLEAHADCPPLHSL